MPIKLHLSAFECHTLKQIRTIVVRSYTCQRCKDTSELELAPYPGKSPPHLFTFTRMPINLHLSASECHTLKQIRTTVVRCYTFQRFHNTSELELATYPRKSPPHLYTTTRMSIKLHLSASECHTLKQIRTIVVRSCTCQRCKDTSELELAPHPGKSPPHLFTFTRMPINLHLSASECHIFLNSCTKMLVNYTCRIAASTS